jgi:hypothetical protein
MSAKSPRRPYEPDDPILTPDEMADDAGIARSTWHRNWRFHPDVEAELIWISAKRIGLMRSTWRRILTSGTRPKMLWRRP